MRFLAPAPHPALARTLAAGALALAPAILAWGAPYEFMNIGPTSGGDLYLPRKAVLMDLDGQPTMAYVDGYQVMAMPLAEGRARVLVDTEPVGGSSRSGPPDPNRVKTPTSLALDAQGRLLIVDRDRHQLLRRIGEGRLEVVPLPAGEGVALTLNEPSGVTAGPHGLTYLTDTFNRRVVMLSRDGKAAVAVGPGGAPPLKTAAGMGWPKDIAACPDGSLVFTTSIPTGAWRLDGKNGLAPIPNLVEPDRDSLSHHQRSGDDASFLVSATSIAPGRDGAVLVGDSEANRLMSVPLVGEKEEVPLPWADSGQDLTLGRVSGTRHGGVVVTAHGGQMWMALPGPGEKTLARWARKAIAATLRGAEGKAEADKYLERIQSGKFATGRAADPERTRVQALAALLHVKNQTGRGREVKAPAGPVPAAGHGTETKQTSPGSASMQPGMAKPRKETSPADAGEMDWEGSGGRAGSGPLRSASGAGAGGQDGSLRLQLSLSQGEGVAVPGLPARDLAAEFRKLEELADRFVARHGLTRPGADRVVGWFKERWNTFDPSSLGMDFDTLTRESGPRKGDAIRVDVLRSFVVTVRTSFAHLPAAMEEWDLCHGFLPVPSQSQDHPESLPASQPPPESPQTRSGTGISPLAQPDR